ncbi:MAG: PolC-type DNA polymerase III [Bacilli bacterium]|nr:PolC-type DNA polymerase III [Bacilli bacterium]MBO6195742.1 PolC-type DNA polymerase III [Bacilli bacterium]
MDSKLELLLDKINLDTEDYKNFKDGKILKIISSKDKLNWNFILELNNLLPISSLEKLDNIKEAFPDLKTVTYTLKIDGITNAKVNEYYTYVINSLKLGKAISMIFLNKEIRFTTNGMVLEASNKAEENVINNKIKDIEKKYKQIGFSKFSLKTELVEEYLNNEEIDKEIKEEAKEAIKEYNNKPKIQSHERMPMASTKENPDSNAILGFDITGEVSKIETVTGEMQDVTIEGYVFGKELFESTKSAFKIITLKVSDLSDSILVKVFFKNEDDFHRIDGQLKENNWYKINGRVSFDNFANDLVLSARNIEEIESKFTEVKDTAEEKRVELHTHTLMSQMDGVVSIEDLIKQAKKWGHRGIAVTDHDGVQAFPNAFNLVRGMNKELAEGEEPFKVIYGCELVMVDDNVDIVIRPTDDDLLDTTYVVFDLETTGFNAGGADSIIEIGATKIRNGEILESFDELIDPGRKLPEKITELTHITDEMLKGKMNEEEGVKKFIEWIGGENVPMVAHNAKFDVSFIEMAYKKYNLGEFKNPVIDTLELSRALDSGEARHSLSAITKRYGVEFDEEGHHRANYDAEGTAIVLHKMLTKMHNQNFKKISEMNNLVPKDEIYKYGRTHDINILTLNHDGLKNLFKIVSLANTKYIYKTPRILRSEIERLRKGLLIGAGCYQSEVFTSASTKSDEELANIIKFYDYVEVQPVDEYCHLVPSVFENEAQLIKNIEKIVRVTEEAGKIIVATGDVHHMKKEDKIYREIIINQNVPGRGRHPLIRNSKGGQIPSQHFRTTDEMLENFEFLGKEKAKEIVITNTNKILDMVSVFDVIVQTGGVPFSPRVKADDGKTYLDCPRVVTDLVYEKAKDWYGEPLPYNIESRLGTELYGDIVLTSVKYYLDKNLSEEEKEKKAFEGLHNVILAGSDAVKDLVRKYLIDTSEEEIDDIEKVLKKNLGGVIGAGFDPIYLIAQRLVKKSNNDGFLVGSRGSVGSSFVATMMGITEVNPLSAHYRCPKCKLSIFEEDGKSLGATYSSGFDLPNKKCPNCGTNMIKDGQDIPFATFLGFNADKVPDIDLNFSDLNQAAIHEYTKVLFGVDNVYRAGTIGTVAEKTAYGYTKGYFEDRGIDKRSIEIERLSKGCTGVKRTTGQHPGGIVVIPDYMDVYDFTPYQFPADDPTSAWRTTHFDYHKIEEDVLKLDILGHSDPTQLRMIQDMSKTDVSKVPLDDKETMAIFLGPEPLGVTTEQIMCNTGTLGIPEFGTKFTIQMVEDTKPKTFGELIKISGLSHGTDVWLGNAQELIRNEIVPFSEVIGCRDDIMVYLMYNGLKPITAFKIMEFVRKGRPSKPKDHDQWVEYENTLKEAGIADWYIESCHKIKYMFPKAHAAAYVTSAFRIAWYKVHMPVYYYASWLSCKATDVDVITMIKGYDAIKSKIIEIDEKGRDASNKEIGTRESLHLCLEATARGIKFLNVDLYNSEATTYKNANDTDIIPPFNSIEGLGDTVAKNIVEERNKSPFISIEEFQNRCKVSATLIDKMRLMGIFGDMPETSQLSLF